MEHVRVAIIGSGPAGLTAAVVAEKLGALFVAQGWVKQARVDEALR